MANPRKKVDFSGIRPGHVTMKGDGVDLVFDRLAPSGISATVLGRALMISADDTVRLCGDNDPVEGELILIEPDGMVVVNTAGYSKLPGGNGATLTPGRPFIGALGAGGARGFIKEVPAAGASPSQAEVRAAANGRGSIVNASDPTKVVVRL